VEEQGEVQRGVGSGKRGTGVARGAKRGGAGQLGLGTWPVRAAGSGREKQREEGAGGRRWGPICNSPKM
jgi:hypothetical protein